MNKRHTTTQHQHLWWTAVILLMLMTLLIHLTGYNFGFPYAEEFDEARLMWNAYAIRTENFDWINLQGYPPGLFWLHYLIQPLVEQQTGRPSEFDGGLVLSIMRVMSIVLNSLTVGILALTGRKFGSAAGGLLAAGAWMLMPSIAFETRLALTESWQVFGYALALLLSIIALKQKSPAVAIFSVMAGLLAVCFKYVAFPALGFGVGVVVWLIYSEKEHQSIWIRTLIIQSALIIGCAIWLFVVYDAAAIGESPEGAAFAGTNILSILNPQSWLPTIERSLNILAIAMPVGIVLLIAGSIFYALNGASSQRLIWFFMLIVYLSNIVLVRMFLVFIDGLNRYLTPVTPVLVLLIVLSMTGIITWLAEKVRFRSLQYILPLLIALVWLPAPAQQMLDMVTEQAKPSTTGTLSAWTLNFLTEADHVLMDKEISYSRQGFRMFDRAMGTYQGDWVPVAAGDITSQSLATWREQENINYYLANDLTLNDAENADAYLDKMLLMKQLPPPDEEELWRGAPLYFYRLWTYQHETDIYFGENIRLRGYDLSKSRVQSGETITFTPYWSADETPTAQYNLYMHLYPESSRDVLVQGDGSPAGEKRLTITWDDPHEIIIGETRTLDIPPEIAPGEYRLAIGLYDWQTAQRLLTPENQDFHVIETITVQASE